MSRPRINSRAARGVTVVLEPKTIRVLDKRAAGKNRVAVMRDIIERATGTKNAKR